MENKPKSSVTCLGSGLAILGAILLFVGAGMDSSGTMGTGGVMLLGGFFLAVFGRLIES